MPRPIRFKSTAAPNSSPRFPFAVRISAIEDPRPSFRGTTNDGACFTVECAGGEIYFLKSNDRYRYTSANEWVAAMLGAYAGFDIMQPVIVEWDRREYYGRRYVDYILELASPFESGAFHAIPNSGDIAYQAIAFDAWIANTDRHDGNLLVVAPSGSSLGHVFLHDHDISVLGRPGLEQFGGLAGPARLSHFIRDPVDGWQLHGTAWIREDNKLREGLTDRARLIAKINQIKSIPDDVVRSIVAEVPPSWVSASDRALMIDFLLARKRLLYKIISARFSSLPRLTR